MSEPAQLGNTEGKKFDGGKVRLDLLPLDAIEEVAKVMTFGAGKYGDRNWEKGINYMRLVGAALRHIFAWVGGQDRDEETGLSHMAHAACCILFILAFETRKCGDAGTKLDDRP